MQIIQYLFFAFNSLWSSAVLLLEICFIESIFRFDLGRNKGVMDGRHHRIHQRSLEHSGFYHQHVLYSLDQSQDFFLVYSASKLFFYFLLNFTVPLRQRASDSLKNIRKSKNWSQIVYCGYKLFRILCMESLHAPKCTVNNLEHNENFLAKLEHYSTLRKVH